LWPELGPFESEATAYSALLGRGIPWGVNVEAAERQKAHMNNESVDSYLQHGCGRCDKFRTPACKVHLWTDALLELRELLISSGLVETMKWGSPCYTLDGKNVVMLTSLKDCCALSFFKGAALADEEGALVAPGPNSQFMRMLTFTSVGDLKERRPQAVGFVQQAIEAERAGLTVAPRTGTEPMPAELEERLDADPDLRRAFESLTPGRQRSHILHVSGAKQSATREQRVEKCAAKILAGRGFNER
jgi:uncharacterized protein YdeI (YjbR/CyaY-like superfamily)